MQEQRKKTWHEWFWSASEFVTKSFGSFIYRRPITVMVVTAFLTVTMMALGLKFSPWPDFDDPTKGFETRHTELSARVVTWTRLGKLVSIYPDPSKPYFRQLQRSESSVEKGEDGEERRKKREATDQGWKQPQESKKSFLESFFLSGWDSSPCLQLRNDFDDMDYFSQVVFEASSLDDLFSLDSMLELCSFQRLVNDSLEPIRPAIAYPYFWSLPNYVTCLAGLFSCQELTEDAVAAAKKTVKDCYQYRDVIIPCGTPPESYRYWRRNYTCSDIPSSCQSKYIYDLFYFILSINVGREGASPVYTTVVLPALQWESYNYLGTANVSAEEMVDIYEDVLALARAVERLQLRGINMGVKFDSWLRSFYGDCYYVFAAFILVYLVIWLYSGSLFFTFAVFFSVVVSMGVAYFVYRLVFRVQFFPFMNLFMVILLIGIGADDAFILKHIFDTSHRTDRPVARMGVASLSKEDMRDALSHAALSMFTCIATTSAAFYANLVSDIVVIKCFGVFAGTTMLVNYLLVVTWLPASIILMDAYLNPLYQRCMPVACLKWIGKVWAAGALVPRFLLLTALPRFVMLLKYLWIALFGLIFIGACVVVFYKPGISLPTNNPLQMFKPSHPLEWFDDHMTEYFNFSQTKFNEPIELALVIGIDPDDDYGLLDPNDYQASGKNEINLVPRFNVDMSFLNAVNDVCHRLNNRSFIYDIVQCFPDRFFGWSKKQSCPTRRNNVTTGPPCCNVKSPHFDEKKDLVHCLAESTKSIDVMTTGGPVFRLANYRGADGFILYFDANRSWTMNYKELREFFTTVEKGVKEVLRTSSVDAIRRGWLTTTFYRATLWYDLQRSLLHGTTIIILVSAGLALVVAAVTMRAFLLSVLSVVTVFAVNVVVIAALILLGWHLNIVESTLMVLTVGLAFDFTLNYAVAYQLSPAGSREQKVCTVLQYMGMPVFLAFLTTFLAGLVMLPSSIMSYYQIGLFMVLVATISWLYSALFFLSLLAVFGPEECEWTLLKNMIPDRVKRVFGRPGSAVAPQSDDVSCNAFGKMNELEPSAASPKPNRT